MTDSEKLISFLNSRKISVEFRDGQYDVTVGNSNNLSDIVDYLFWKMDRKAMSIKRNSGSSENIPFIVLDNQNVFNIPFP